MDSPEPHIQSESPSDLEQFTRGNSNHAKSNLSDPRVNSWTALVKGMEANMLIGEDTQLVWQLHTIRPRGKRYWKVGDSPHLIPGMLGPVPVESFVACWNYNASIPKKPSTSTTPQQRSLRTQWNAVAKIELLIRPESIATITTTYKTPRRKKVYSSKALH